MKLFGGALGAALMIGASPALLAQPAAGQAQQLHESERAAVQPLYEAYARRDWAAAAAALPAARAGARTAYARYVVGQIQFETGQQIQNMQMQSEGLAAMAASGAAPAETMGPLLVNQAALAVQANDLPRAEQLLGRAAELNPNDPMILIQLAEVRQRRGNRQEAAQLYQRAIHAGETGGQRPPERIYKRALALAMAAPLPAATLDLSRRFVAAYPSPINWRDALLAYGDLAQADPATRIDLLRLMRAAGAVQGERDLLQAARAFNEAGLAGEAKALMDEGVRSNMLDTGEAETRDLLALVTRRATAERSGLAAQRTQARAAATGAPARAAADILYGQGSHAEAAELYRTALQKGGEDPDLLNLRLGAALAMAGQRAEAEAALRAVGGQRQNLAAYWLLWLAQPRG